MKIVFSYDCEGNWGFVDWPYTPLADCDPKALEAVYKTLCRRHEELDIPATFAFVGLYALPMQERLKWVKDRLGTLHHKLPNVIASGGLWEGAKNVATVARAAAESRAVEIGSHGLTHRPISGLPLDAQQLEFSASAEILTRATGQQPQTFVFPRNLVAGRSACLTQYSAYRDTEALSVTQRAIDANRAVLGIDLPRKAVSNDFIFWKGGRKKYISDRGWKRLWRARMRDAQAGRGSGRVSHVWSHPHNFLTDPGLAARFEWLMDLLNDNRAHLEFAALSEMKMCRKR